jgi:hypothetical protein
MFQVHTKNLENGNLTVKIEEVEAIALTTIIDATIRMAKVHQTATIIIKIRITTQTTIVKTIIDMTSKIETIMIRIRVIIIKTTPQTKNAIVPDLNLQE